MKVVDLRGFRKANSLTQGQVAKYFNVTAPFVTSIETGKHKLPADKLEMLLNNDQGWDTSMLLVEQDASISATATGRSSANVSIGSSDVSSAVYAKEAEMLREQISLLKAQLAEKDKMIDFLKTLIQK